MDLPETDTPQVTEFMVSIIMNPKKTVDEKLSNAFDIEFTKESTEIIKKEDELPMKRAEDIEKDYNLVRSNIKDLIGTGEEAIDGIIKVATEGDHPRAYEVAAQMIKTVAEMNHDLIDLHKKMKDIKKEETTQNSLYVGSTSDLQDLINQSRSSKKALDEEIIDVEID